MKLIERESMTSFIATSANDIELANKSQRFSLVSEALFKLKQGQTFLSSFFHSRLNILNIFRIFRSLASDSSYFVSTVNKSNFKLMRVEPEIGETQLKHLAEVCHRSDKAVFLNLPHADELPQKHKAIAWSVKRALDWFAAFIILIVLSPVMLSLAVIISGTSSGSIFFHQWRVGESGKLFRIIKFRTMITDADKLHHLVMSGQTGLHKCEDDPRITPVGRWMRKYSLDELPQLFNVLRGEMSLVGPRPWALYDALRINGDGKRRLNSLPGVTGAWQVSLRSTMLDLDAVTECDLNYLRDWNLWSDLKILLMTIPKVLSGFGAF
jgi:lipopolysaccharide/colanic/teichoic acid biosynthesis glycosyltransferase